LAAVPIPVRSAIASTGSSVVSSNRCAAITRWPISQRAGEVPVCAWKRRQKVRSLIPARRARRRTEMASRRFCSAQSSAGASGEPVSVGAIASGTNCA